MKVIAILSFILLSTFTIDAQTTLEEYNYVTKGYKETVEKGLDLKKGYRFVDLHENYTTNTSDKGTIKRTMLFKGLYRDGENTPCAIMVIYNRSDNGFKEYVCIPHFNSDKEIWDMYAKQMKSYTGEGADAMLWGLGKSAAFFAKNN